MIYMIADDPAGGELLDQQANRELDEIVHATLGGDRDSLNVAVQMDFRNQPTVIMSLWSVEDNSTLTWMRALYEGRLQKKLDTASAVREASLSVLRSRRAKGESTHPFYWPHSSPPEIGDDRFVRLT